MINEKIKSWNIVRETIVRKFYILANFLALRIIFGMLGRYFVGQKREEGRDDHILRSRFDVYTIAHDRVRYL